LITLLLLLAAQDDGPKTADVPNAMGAHTWFVIFAVGAFLLWSISYSLQLHKAGTLAEKKYKQDLKDLKFQLAKVVDKLRRKSGDETAKGTKGT
jgi:hypothetical protein